MIAPLLIALTAQTAPTFPFPTEIKIRPGEVFQGTLVRTFTDPADELTLVQTDRVQTTVKASPESSARFLLVHSVQPVSEVLDGNTRNYDPKMTPAQVQEELRTLRGIQFRWSTALDDGDALMRLSRFLTLPLPTAPVAIGDDWEFSDRRFMPYTFRGRVTGFAEEVYQVRVNFKSLSAPNYTANGTVWVGRNGMPRRVELSANGVTIPGGEGVPVQCKIDFRLN